MNILTLDELSCPDKMRRLLQTGETVGLVDAGLATGTMVSFRHNEVDWAANGLPQPPPATTWRDWEGMLIDVWGDGMLPEGTFQNMLECDKVAIE